MAQDTESKVNNTIIAEALSTAGDDHRLFKQAIA
jgi:hypothetical protein